MLKHLVPETSQTFKRVIEAIDVVLSTSAWRKFWNRNTAHEFETLKEFSGLISNYSEDVELMLGNGVTQRNWRIAIADKKALFGPETAANDVAESGDAVARLIDAVEDSAENLRSLSFTVRHIIKYENWNAGMRLMTTTAVVSSNLIHSWSSSPQHRFTDWAGGAKQLSQVTELLRPNQDVQKLWYKALHTHAS